MDYWEQAKWVARLRDVKTDALDLVLLKLEWLGRMEEFRVMSDARFVAIFITASTIRRRLGSERSAIKNDLLYQIARKSARNRAWRKAGKLLD